ncbi:MAG: F0F1 ATP synthase subunit delta [Gammaproteobacteria bacterium]
MQEKLTIARPYAAAAFEYASEHNDVDGWAALLNRLAEAVSEPALAAVIGHPKVSRESLLGLLGEVLGESLEGARRNFLETVIDAERLDIAPQIAELFERRRADAAGVVSVEVISAFPLTDAERQKIDAAVQKRLGRSCEVESEVDSSLIGGAVIRIGDEVIDLSLRGRLAALAQQLA